MNTITKDQIVNELLRIAERICKNSSKNGRIDVTPPQKEIMSRFYENKDGATFTSDRNTPKWCAKNTMNIQNGEEGIIISSGITIENAYTLKANDMSHEGWSVKVRIEAH